MEANANQFIHDIEARILKIKQAMVGTKDGGDYRETLGAHLSILTASRDAAVLQRDYIITQTH